MRREELVAKLDDFEKEFQARQDECDQEDPDLVFLEDKVKKLNFKYGGLRQYILHFTRKEECFRRQLLGPERSGGFKDYDECVQQIQWTKGQIDAMDDEQFEALKNSLKFRFTKPEIKTSLEKFCLYTHPIYLVRLAWRYNIGKVVLIIIGAVAGIVTILVGYEDALEKVRGLFVE